MLYHFGDLVRFIPTGEFCTYYTRTATYDNPLHYYPSSVLVCYSRVSGLTIGRVDPKDLELIVCYYGE